MLLELVDLLNFVAVLGPTFLSGTKYLMDVDEGARSEVQMPFSIVSDSLLLCSGMPV